VLQAAPAIHQHEDGYRSQPDVLSPDSETDEAGDPYQAEYCGYHQAASAAQHKPEQGAENLAAIQRIDGKDIENQQPLVDELDL
jgi:hypothetical protein